MRIRTFHSWISSTIVTSKVIFYCLFNFYLYLIGFLDLYLSILDLFEDSTDGIFQILSDEFNSQRPDKVKLLNNLMRLGNKSERIQLWDKEFAFRHTNQLVKYSTCNFIEKISIVQNIPPWMSNLIVQVITSIGDINAIDDINWGDPNRIIDDLDNTVNIMNTIVKFIFYRLYFL